MIFSRATIAATLALITSTYAKTDIAGCTSSQVIANGGASLLYYVPGSGEICSFLDCGGGRAPPKTTVPGCPQYAGTETYKPEFLPGVQAGASMTGSAIASASATALADTTTTLMTQSSVPTSGLLFDTSAATRSVTNLLTVTSATPSGSASISAPASVTPNAAGRGKDLAIAAMGVAAGFALL